MGFILSDSMISIPVMGPDILENFYGVEGKKGPKCCKIGFLSIFLKFHPILLWKLHTLRIAVAHNELNQIAK